ARKRAKAEASKARVASARKELELKKQEALLAEQKRVSEAQVERKQKDIAAELVLLEEEKEAAAADAKAAVSGEVEDGSNEEFDLLVKYLGPVSSVYARSLRASNTVNPSRGLALLWERLDERYGSPERMEACLKAKINSFPTLTMKNCSKLYDLCDILDEIQSAKTNPSLSAQFAVYDSSAGISSIVPKLPISLRNKWINQASRFKDENHVTFPPFTFLIHFLRKVTRTVNDPAFTSLIEALRRAHLLHKSMDKNPQKKDHMVKFMAKLFETGAAERAPPIEEGRSRWYRYLPLFGVYHPRKPDKIRGVFDSSAIFQGFSLNSMLLSGPDLTNNLIGILIRFRRDSRPITADIEQMFYQFNVDEQHRDFLRFLWFEDNKPEKGLVEYRMTVHLPMHSCLGLPWCLQRDAFMINPKVGKAQFTRRGLLSALNSIYDPIGFLSPATISGKILLRRISPDGKTWDEPLPESFLPDWQLWTKHIQSLNGVAIPRMYISTSLTQTAGSKLHVFFDASEEAVAAVAYLEVRREHNREIGFVMGKAKLAPKSGHTVPRLELCGAVLAVELYQTISEHLGVPLEHVAFHTDSKVVLGYISNETRRFYTYVSNRVEKIRSVTSPAQWRYISTEFNPADVATRSNSVESVGLLENVRRWLQPPHDAFHIDVEAASNQSYPLICPNDDTEIRAIELEVVVVIVVVVLVVVVVVVVIKVVVVVPVVVVVVFE
ncbi:Gag-pol fusion polyprotein, partial [Elysia marginata]